MAHSTFPEQPAVPEVVPAQQRLFQLPFIEPAFAEEVPPIGRFARGLEIVKRPHLLSWKIEPSIVPLGKLMPKSAPAADPKPAVQTPAVSEVSTQEAARVNVLSAAEPAPHPAASAQVDPPSPSSGEDSPGGLAEEAAPEIRWWTQIPRVWAALPMHVRALAMALPIIFVLAFSRSLPSVSGALGSNSGAPIQKAFTQGLGSVRQQLASRAAIDFTDDFRTGLDDWQGSGNTTAAWSYDAAGFVRPGKLALYRPSISLQDYRFEFLGEIDERAMGCVFRAADPDNYYAVKFAVARPGPMPLVKLVRYAVVNGREQRHDERPLPFLSSADTLYRVLIDVHGSDFTIMSQGKVVDFWSDTRLKSGGVGLFCGRGERARVRWVEVSHQYDTLGKLCAYLAPYSGQGRSGSLN